MIDPEFFSHPHVGAVVDGDDEGDGPCSVAIEHFAPPSLGLVVCIKTGLHAVDLHLTSDAARALAARLDAFAERVQVDYAATREGAALMPTCDTAVAESIRAFTMAGLAQAEYDARRRPRREPVPRARPAAKPVIIPDEVIPAGAAARPEVVAPGPAACPDLNDLAGEIERAHREATVVAATAIDRAIRVGELLARAKAAVKHGEWGAWVEGHCSFGVRQASDYVRAYNRREQIGGQPAASGGLQGAIARLATPRPGRAEKKAAGPAAALPAPAPGIAADPWLDLETLRGRDLSSPELDPLFEGFDVHIAGGYVKPRDIAAELGISMAELNSRLIAARTRPSAPAPAALPAPALAAPPASAAAIVAETVAELRAEYEAEGDLDGWWGRLERRLMAAVRADRG